MAFKTVPPPDSSLLLDVLYNVTQPVGPKPLAADSPDDVMLVQLCLKQIFENRFTFSPVPPPLASGSTIVVDGKFGPITQEAIVTFQNYVRNIGLSIRPDGFVNRAGDFSGTSPTAHTIYTIVWLNQFLAGVIGQDRFNHLEDDPITPFALQVRLAASAA